MDGCEGCMKVIDGEEVIPAKEFAGILIDGFINDLMEAAKENWCESHVKMLDHLIDCVCKGEPYGELCDPEDRQESERYKLSSSQIPADRSDDGPPPGNAAHNCLEAARPCEHFNHTDLSGYLG